MRTSRLFSFGFGLTAASIAAAAVLEVSQEAGAPYATIQSAINAAVPNTDEVYVRCGRYLENIVMRSGVPVRGERPQCTFIDGRGLGPVVTMNEIVDTKVSGFTIENGEDDLGGGIRVMGGSPIIDGNHVRNNQATVNPDGFESGGGIGVLWTSDLLAPVITRNLITGNTGAMSGGAVVSGTGRVEGNLFAGNRGEFAALSLYAFYGTALNNTVVRNLSGPGIRVAYSASATIGSNVVAYNPYGIAASSTATFAKNDVFGNGLNYIEMPDQTGLNGNVSVDPLFVSENEESFVGYEPKCSSPIIERAGPTATVELSGLTTPVDGWSSGARLRDIGARENEGVTTLRWAGKTNLRWDSCVQMPGLLEYNAFRGDLETLRSTGVYVQNPSVVPSARQFCDQSPTSLIDAEIPPPGVGWFYLAAGWGSARGPLGFDSARNVRPDGWIPCTWP